MYPRLHPLRSSEAVEIEKPDNSNSQRDKVIEDEDEADHIISYHTAPDVMLMGLPSHDAASVLSGSRHLHSQEVL